MSGTQTPTSGLRVSAKAARADTRATNRRLVLQQLFDGQVLSRADLSRATSLTPATISSLIKELQDDELIIETDSESASDSPRVGKPPVLLRLNAQARCSVSVDLSIPNEIRAAVVDLGGTIIESVTKPLNGATGQAAVALVLEVAREAIARTNIPILGVGVGAPGVVSPAGLVAETPRFGWHEIDLQQVVGEALNLPAYVANDANVLAIAEYSRGGHDCAHLAVIRIGSGVGAGLILNGRSFHGQHSGAGEIGHLVVDPAGPACSCGHSGCLESFLSSPSIERALAEPGTDRQTVLHEAANRLGIALAAIVSILDLGKIIVSGPITVLGDTFCEEAAASMRSHSLASVASAVDIEYSSLGEDGVLLGAAALVLSKELGVA